MLYIHLHNDSMLAVMSEGRVIDPSLKCCGGPVQSPQQP